MSAAPVPFDKPDTKGAKPKPCPICRRPSVEALAPFCSKRCADVDLHRWLGGVYAVPDDEPGQPDVTTDDSEDR